MTTSQDFKHMSYLFEITNESTKVVQKLRY